MVSTCFSWTTSDVWRLFPYPLAIHALVCLLWKNVCSRPLPTGLLDRRLSRHLVVWVRYVFFDMDPFSDTWLAGNVPHSAGGLFSLLTVCFAVQKPYKLVSPTCLL